MFYIDPLQNEEFSWRWNWVNCTTVKLWTSRIECSTWEWREFFYSKKERFVYKTKWQNLSSDNERLFWNSDWYLMNKTVKSYSMKIGEYCNKAPFHWEGKNDDLGKTNRRSICELVSDWCVHWSNNRIRSCLCLSILFSFSNSLSIIDMFKLSPHTNLLHYVLTVCSIMQHLRLLCFSWINWVLRIVFVEVLLWWHVEYHCRLVSSSNMRLRLVEWLVLVVQVMLWQWWQKECWRSMSRVADLMMVNEADWGIGVELLWDES